MIVTVSSSVSASRAPVTVNDCGVVQFSGVNLISVGATDAAWSSPLVGVIVTSLVGSVASLTEYVAVLSSVTLSVSGAILTARASPSSSATITVAESGAVAR